MLNLPRQLLFTDLNDIDEYFNQWDWVGDIYSLFLEIKDKEYRWKHTSTNTFNEVFYQLTRIAEDSHPEENTYHNYICDAKNDMGTRYAADLVFCLVWVIIQLKRNKTNKEKAFISALKKNVDESAYVEPIYAFLRENKELEIDFSIAPSPANPKLLPEYNAHEWDRATNNFDQATIKRIIERYQNKEDKLIILSLIEQAFNDASMPGYDFPF